MRVARGRGRPADLTDPKTKAQATARDTARRFFHARNSTLETTKHSCGCGQIGKGVRLRSGNLQVRVLPPAPVFCNEGRRSPRRSVKPVAKNRGAGAAWFNSAASHQDGEDTAAKSDRAETQYRRRETGAGMIPFRPPGSRPIPGLPPIRVFSKTPPCC